MARLSLTAAATTGGRHHRHQLPQPPKKYLFCERVDHLIAQTIVAHNTARRSRGNTARPSAPARRPRDCSGWAQSEASRNGVSLAAYLHAIFGLVTQASARATLMIGLGVGTLGTMLIYAGRSVIAIFLRSTRSVTGPDGLG